jgi:hypothetical protein
MRYIDFRDSIRAELRRHATGLTWAQLRQRLDLPYDRPCPAWTQQLEREIGLTRMKGGNGSRALVWKMASRRPRKTVEAK